MSLCIDQAYVTWSPWEGGTRQYAGGIKSSLTEDIEPIMNRTGACMVNTNPWVISTQFHASVIL